MDWEYKEGTGFNLKYSGWEASLRKWHLNQDWREEMPGRHQAMQEKALGGESGKQDSRGGNKGPQIRYLNGSTNS